MAVAIELLHEESSLSQLSLPGIDVDRGKVIPFPGVALQGAEESIENELPVISPEKFGLRQFALPFLYTRDSNINHLFYVKALRSLPEYRQEIGKRAESLFKAGSLDHLANWCGAQNDWVNDAIFNQRFFRDFQKVVLPYLN